MEFTIAFEGWKSRPKEFEDILRTVETEELQNLKLKCQALHELSWWNTYVSVGKNPRGNHLGVHFGYEMKGANPDELEKEVRSILKGCHFQMEVGELTEWEDR